MAGIDRVAVVMFEVSDVDAAIGFYVGTLGFDLREDDTFGAGDEDRWVEVAPPGAETRIALLPPGAGLGVSAIGLEVADVAAEHARLAEFDDVDVDEAVKTVPGAPAMFALRDPDGNSLWVVEAA